VPVWSAPEWQVRSGHARRDQDPAERARVADDIFSHDMADWHAERNRAFARRVAAGGVIAACAIVVGLGAWQYTAYRHGKTDDAASARYFDAARTVQTAHGLKAPLPANVASAGSTLADLQANGPAAMRGYAGFQLANLRQQSGDLAGAQQAWHTISAANDVPESQRQLATLLSLEASEGHADAKVLREGFTSLSQRPGPWQALAQEQLVGLDLAPGATAAQSAEAQRILTRLSQNAAAPEGVRERAQMMLQTFGDATGGAG
jgi:hypothetical protein